MGRKRDLIGQRFGRLTVIGEGERASNGSIKWICRCECGNEIHIRGDLLISGNTKSCGCLSRDAAKSHLEGQRFGNLTVIKEDGRSKYGDVMWLCQCDCGNTTRVKSVDLIHNNTHSCGCFKLARISETNTIHGKCNTKLYHIWHGIKNRCYNPNHDNYIRYGARSIQMCDEWVNNFQAFYDWAITHGFEENLTIDRINNYKGYSPDNCRWITPKEQQHNRRDTVFLTYKGETKSLPEWAEIMHINVDALRYRIKAHWSVDKALETPVKSINKSTNKERLE